MPRRAVNECGSQQKQALATCYYHDRSLAKGYNQTEELTTLSKVQHGQEISTGDKPFGRFDKAHDPFLAIAGVRNAM